MRFENGIEIRTQGEALFDANSLNNANIEVVRKTDYDKLKAMCSWKDAATEKPSHGNAVAISPCINGHEFACYNSYEHCWDTEDGDDVLCEYEKVKMWFEIPPIPKEIKWNVGHPESQGQYLVRYNGNDFLGKWLGDSWLVYALPMGECYTTAELPWRMKDEDA